MFNCLSTCSNQVALANTTQKELFIQSQILLTGIYKCKLTVTTTDNSSTLSSSSSMYIEITDSNINTNLVSIDKLTIKHNFKQVLLLNPGQYSYDPDRLIFDSYVSPMKNATNNFVKILLEMELYILLSNLSFK